jgi:hypothetical protein
VGICSYYGGFLTGPPAPRIAFVSGVREVVAEVTVTPVPPVPPLIENGGKGEFCFRVCGGRALFLPRSNLHGVSGLSGGSGEDHTEYVFLWPPDQMLSAVSGVLRQGPRASPASRVSGCRG